MRNSEHRKQKQSLSLRIRGASSLYTREPFYCMPPPKGNFLFCILTRRLIIKASPVQGEVSAQLTEGLFFQIPRIKRDKKVHPNNVFLQIFHFIFRGIFRWELTFISSGFIIYSIYLNCTAAGQGKVSSSYETVEGRESPPLQIHC